MNVVVSPTRRAFMLGERGAWELAYSAIKK